MYIVTVISMWLPANWSNLSNKLIKTSVYKEQRYKYVEWKMYIVH